MPAPDEKTTKSKGTSGLKNLNSFEENKRKLISSNYLSDNNLKSLSLT